MLRVWTTFPQIRLTAIAANPVIVNLRFADRTGKWVLQANWVGHRVSEVFILQQNPPGKVKKLEGSEIVQRLHGEDTGGTIEHDKWPRVEWRNGEVCQ